MASWLQGLGERQNTPVLFSCSQARSGSSADGELSALSLNLPGERGRGRGAKASSSCPPLQGPCAGFKRVRIPISPPILHSAGLLTPLLRSLSYALPVVCASRSVTPLAGHMPLDRLLELLVPRSLHLWELIIFEPTSLSVKWGNACKLITCKLIAIVVVFLTALHSFFSHGPQIHCYMTVFAVDGC